MSSFLIDNPNIFSVVSTRFFSILKKNLSFLQPYAATFSGSTDLGDGQLTGDLAAVSCCNSGSGDPILGLADFTLEAGLGQSIGVFAPRLGVLGR